MRPSSIASTLLLALSLPIGAQVQQASLEGTVVSASGLLISGATIRITDAATNQSRAAVSDASGKFRLGSVTPRVYELRVDSPGFATYERHGVELPVGRTIHLTIALSSAAMAETVDVSAQPPGLDTSETSASTIVDNERIEELPVRSRNYLEFVLLAPGVVSTRSGGGVPGASRLSDSGFSFAGLRPRSNTLTIDGLDNNDEYSGSSRTELSLETVKEFEVVNHGWSAENGGGSGGAINVLTKSGANVIHGDAFLFGQSGRFDSRPFLESADARTPSLERYRGGAAAGGPIERDRTFYYAAVEQEERRGEATSDIDPRTATIINAALSSTRPSGSGAQHLTSGLFATGMSETELSAKVSHQVTPRDAVVARIAGTGSREKGDAFNQGGFVDFSSRGTSSTGDLAAIASWTTIIGEKITNELRGQRAGRHVSLRTTDAEGPGIVIPGVVELGRPYAGNSEHRQVYSQAGDTAGLAHGNHFWRMGVDATGICLDGTSNDGFGGLYLFRSVDALTRQQPDSFRQVFGDPSIDVRATRYAFFVQDQWTRSALTIDAGIRLDGEVLPAALGISDRQITPRFGLAWTPVSRWVIRGGAGIFADRLPLAAFERALSTDGTRGFEQIVDGPAAAALFAGQRGSNQSPLPGIASSVYRVRGGRWNPSSLQSGIGAEHLLTAGMTASVNYLFARGRDLLRTVNVNLLPPVILTPGNAGDLGISDPTAQQFGRPVFGPGRRDIAHDGIFELQPTASSTYNGLTLAINRRLFRDAEWSASYTWSRTTDDASDFDEQPQNPYALADEKAPSRYDQRHRFVASALFEVGDADDRATGGKAAAGRRGILSNIEIAPILSIDSGRPVNPVTGFDADRSHAFPLTARPLGQGRNSLRLPATATLNIRLLKYFLIEPHAKLDLVIGAFNLLNRKNVTEVNAVWGLAGSPSSDFGRPTEASPARQIEFSVDLEF
jgi:Carboxypeptidase regulatory-like domain/TonB dependent receptor/TonB-dependent Receptor Plug Domain